MGIKWQVPVNVGGLGRANALCAAALAETREQLVTIIGATLLVSSTLSYAVDFVFM